VVSERRHKNPKANGTLALEPGREQERKQLGFVPHFGKGDHHGRDKQAPHGMFTLFLADVPPYFSRGTEPIRDKGARHSMMMQTN
jgi:hypothetical protein